MQTLQLAMYLFSLDNSLNAMNASKYLINKSEERILLTDQLQNTLKDL